MFSTTTVFLAMLCLCRACLITNCPRGGKRSELVARDNVRQQIKQCVSCGPNHSGQCFGPDICCGPFGCLIGTSESLRCQRDGYFNEPRPCIAGISNCRKNTGRCASQGICCNQDSCHVDTSCNFEEKLKQDSALESIYNIFSLQTDYGNDI